MFYQRATPLKGAASETTRRAANRRDKAKLVQRGQAHAALVYQGQTAVGWCQYGLRDELPRIDAGRFYRKVPPMAGETTLWRITCFFVDPKFRGKGVAQFALKAALESIRKKGGGTVEAYPVVSPAMAAVAEWRWFGTPGMFRKEGFREVARLGKSGVLMRKEIRA